MHTTSLFAITTLAVGITARSHMLATETKTQQTSKLGKFKFVGVNLAGPEFGEKIFPGKKGEEYIWPDNNSVQHFIDRKMNTFRINILMERLIPDQLNGSFAEEYLHDMKESVKYITEKGAYAMICPHNYGRYYSKIIENPDDFKAWWAKVAHELKDDNKVIWDTNNEYHDMNQSLVVRLNQAAIDGIRSTGAKQDIHVEGNSWSGAWTWVSNSKNGATMANLKDPEDRLVYHMHQYLDADGSGTQEACVSSTIGKERMVEATNWLKEHHKRGFLGEFAGGDNSQCKEAVTGMLKYLQENSDVWIGWNWWAAGPWWGSYMYSLEQTGKAYKPYFDILMAHT